MNDSTPRRLVSVSDIARTRGCSRQAVDELTRSPGFPAPVPSDGRGRRWWEDEVRPYFTPQPPGRPRKQPSPGAQGDKPDQQTAELRRLVLHAALDAFLRSTGLPFYQRGDSVTVVIDADKRVTVEFPPVVAGRPLLIVRYPGGGCGEFSAPLPPAAALTGLVQGLIDAAAG